MTYAEAVAKMEAIAERSLSEGDTEIEHLEADSLLCEWLRENGYSDLVAAYGRVGKWYA